LNETDRESILASLSALECFFSGAAAVERCGMVDGQIKKSGI